MWSTTYTTLAPQQRTGDYTSAGTWRSGRSLPLSVVSRCTSNAADAGQWAHGELFGIDDHVGVVRDHGTLAGGDQRLGFDGFVAVVGS
jgi:hypothetical protein